MKKNEIPRLLVNQASQTAQNVYFGLLAAVCAAFFYFAIPGEARLYYSIGVLPFLAAVSFFFLIKYVYPLVVASFKQEDKETWVTLILSMLLSSCLVVGANLKTEASTSQNFLMYPPAILLVAFLFYGCLLIFWRFLDQRSLASVEGKPLSKRAARRSAPPLSLTRKATIALLLLFILCWTPILLASWPGYFCYDVGSDYLAEWGQFESGQLNSHHPVLHTLLLGTIINIGRNLRDFNTGIALFTILQALFIAGVFTYMIFWLKRNGGKGPLLGFSVAYLALNPLVSMFVLCSTKDTLFSACAVLLCLLIYTMLSNKHKKQYGIRDLLPFGVVAFFICTLRVNALYVFILFVPALLLFSRKDSRIRLLSTCAAVLLACFVWFVPVSQALNVEASFLQRVNAFSIPSQQLAYVTTRGTLSEDEKRFLENHHYQYPQEYAEDLADVARASLLEVKTIDIIKIWFAVGIQHPVEYIHAFLLQTQAAWNPYEYMTTYTSHNPDNPAETSLFTCTTEPPGTADSKFESLGQFLWNISNRLVLQKIPFLSFLVSLPIYLWLFLVVLARSIITKDKARLGSMAFLALLILSVFIGPCALIRYYLYLFFGLPLLLYFLISGKPPHPAPKVEAVT